MIPDSGKNDKWKLTHKERNLQIINNYIWEVRFCVFFVFFAFFALVPQIPQESDCVFSSGEENGNFQEKLLLNFELGVILNQIRVS